MTALSPVVEGAAGAGGNAILIAPGYMSPGRRNAYTCEVAYLNGWPHAVLTEVAAEGAQTISVDNVTGFASAAAFAYDGAATETVNAVTATAAAPVSLPWGATGTPVTVDAGPGTVTLASPLAYEHQPGTVVSAIPQDIAWAVIMLAAAQVLAEGATAVAIPDIAGSLTSGGKGVGDLIADARDILSAYKRVI